MSGPLDLVVLVPDSHWRAVMQEMLGRHKALGIRPIRTRDPLVHPQRDPGVRLHGAKLLKSFVQKAKHALLVVDFEGSGSDGTPLALQAALQQGLQADWGDRAWAVVVDPELESWLIAGHKHLPTLVGAPTAPAPRDWWREHGHWSAGMPKPVRPKEALEGWLNAQRVRPTSSLWRELAAKTSLRPNQCSHESFPLLVAKLREWFPAGPS